MKNYIVIFSIFLFTSNIFSQRIERFDKVKINYNNTYVKIIIVDDGDGFSKDIIDKLGEPYISKNNQGMGLGIFIAKNLIENMGGSINFYNSKEDNAIVEIVFDNSILNI